MNRRSYLLLSGGALTAVAGCTGDGDGNGERTPYADSSNSYESDGGDVVTHTFSGTGTAGGDDSDGEPAYTDTFSHNTTGPTIIEYDHDGDDTFSVWFVDENQDRISLGYSAVGPFEGRTIHSLDEQTLGLSVDADGDWEVSVTELPVYNTGESLPVTVESILVDVVGPIEFSDDSDITFTFTATGGAGHTVDLFNREGELSARVFEIEDDVEDETLTADIGGVGYILVESGGEWELSIDTAD